MFGGVFMDYFIVFLLVLIIFTFLSDQKVLQIDEIERKIKHLNKEISRIHNDLLVISIDENTKNDTSTLLETIREKINNDNKKYIMLKDSNVKLTAKEIKLIIANYINKEEKMSGFLANYEYQYIENRKFKNMWNELRNMGINYLNIFSKSDIKVHSVIIMKNTEVENVITNSNKLITFAPCEELKILPSKINKEEFLRKIEKVYDSDIKAILKSILLVIVGVSVTANLIYAVYSLHLGELIIAYIMYWCYSYVLKYMYSPIGKYKVLARYLLPLFVVIYLVFQLINSIKRKGISNKKVQAS